MLAFVGSVDKIFLGFKDNEYLARKANLCQTFSTFCYSYTELLHTHPGMEITQASLK